MTSLYRHLTLLLLGLLFTFNSLGCASTGIAVKEFFGQAKREQLVDRVQDARDEQTEAKEQFESALAEFLALTGADGGELEAMYERLKDEADASEKQAEDVRKRIRDVERVADALFAEWAGELEEYANQDMRRASERQLSETRMRYNEMLTAMKRAEAKMEPVLAAFNDQVLFLKHNLNARAIASLESNFAKLETDIETLVSEMEQSIREANAFIEEMGTADGGGP
ncbi:MAG: DUF2959 domain-containing protein [Planctomycetes bacterium]|nr:DUF2959 domain-containing protein [Planctomycetota bacterium]NOG55135.1 DUF2959 domain-containing protein [Planctomycetota bacterium]